MNDRRRLRSRLLHRKPADDLRLAVVQELEVVLLQVAHRVPLSIAHHHPNLDEIDLHLEGG